MQKFSTERNEAGALYLIRVECKFMDTYTALAQGQILYI